MDHGARGTCESQTAMNDPALRRALRALIDCTHADHRQFVSQRGARTYRECRACGAISRGVERWFLPQLVRACAEAWEAEEKR